MADASAVRVRFAPSPTGDLHIGGVWLAQFDWLFAKQQGGKFIVRLEDTDQKRLVAGSIQKIYEALDWYGLTPDEGPLQGGDYGPYVQSQRLSLYQKYAQQLVASGHAYHCFCSPERLEELRARQQAAKLPPRYDKHCAHLPPTEVETRRANGEPAVIRLNVPSHGSVSLDDRVRGQVTFSFDQVDDSILVKSDGFPTYHLAVVVDDHLMEITHVLRAEEWLSSTPKHLLLYQAFGWTPPQFAHLPQILGPSKKKLSKREGAVSALHFRDQGYLVEAMQNFLALMGWHPKGDTETLTRAQILEQFSLRGINPSGAIFDQVKLDWLNGWYIRSLPTAKLLERIKPWWHIPAGEGSDDQHLQSILRLVQERLRRLNEIDEASNFMFPSVWDEEVQTWDINMIAPKKGTVGQAISALQWASQMLEPDQSNWVAAELREKVLALITQAGKNNGGVLWPLRVALSLRAASPDVFDLLALLGPAESQRRISVVITRCSAR